MKSRTVCCGVLVLAAGVLTAPRCCMAELTAVIVRSVPMVTGEFSTFGAGLATDGTRLFASNGTNRIEEYDLETFQLNRIIETSIGHVHGLEYVDGVIYAGQSYRDDVTKNPSRIYRLSPISGEVFSFFDAPENAITEISMGNDGIIYGIDGFDNRAARRTKLHGFSPLDGVLVSTIPARIQQIMEFEVPDLLGTGTFLPLTDGTFLADTGGILNQVAVLNNELVRLDPIEGLPRAFSRGSARVGHRLFFTGSERVGSELVYSVYEFHLIPEPPTVLLVLFGSIAFLVLFAKARRNHHVAL